VFLPSCKIVIVLLHRHYFTQFLSVLIVITLLYYCTVSLESPMNDIFRLSLSYLQVNFLHRSVYISCCNILLYVDMLGLKQVKCNIYIKT
jgi:hypothetical protein